MYYVFLQNDEIEARWDCNHYDPKARTVRQGLRQSAIPLQSLADISIEMFSGPFGSNLKVDEYVDFGLPIIRPVNLSTGFNSTNIVSMRAEVAKEKKLKIIDQNTLLFARVGDPAVGKLPLTMSKATISPNIIAARFSDLSMLYYILTFFNTRSANYLLSAAIKRVTQPTVGVEEIGIIQIPVVEHNLCVAIGNKLKAAEKLQILASNAKIKIEHCFPSYRPKRQGLHTRWINHKELESSRIEPNYYDTNYTEAIDQVIKYAPQTYFMSDLVNSTRHGASVPNNYASSGNPRFIRGLEILPNRISRSEKVLLSRDAAALLSANHYVKQGELLITRSGTVGTCAIVRKTEDGNAFGSFIIAAEIKDWVEPEYICAFLNSPLGQMQFRREENGAVQLNINNEELARIRVPIIHKQERQIIVNAVNGMNSFLDRSEDLVSEAIQDVESLIFGNFDENQCLEKCRQLAEEFGLESP